MKLPIFKKKNEKPLPILKKENIQFMSSAMSEKQAIDYLGQQMLSSGYIEEKYIQGMHQRDESLSVFVGNYLAIPHGEFEYKEAIIQSGIAVLVFEEAILWHGQPVHFVCALAGKGDEHMKILSNIATIFSDEDEVLQLLHTGSVDKVYHAFNSGGLS